MKDQKRNVKLDIEKDMKWKIVLKYVYISIDVLTWHVSQIVDGKRYLM